MILQDLKGRPCTFKPFKYRIDWDRAVSAPQKAVKDFLKPYWEKDLVLEEPRIPRSLFRLDLWNCSRCIVVEVSPAKVHQTYNPFFHGSLAGYRASLKRDLEKARWCEVNGLTLVEVTDSDFPLTRAFFKTRFNIDL